MPDISVIAVSILMEQGRVGRVRRHQRVALDFLLADLVALLTAVSVHYYLIYVGQFRRA